MQPTFVATNIFVSKKMVVVSVPANNKYQEFHNRMVEFKVNVHGAFQASTERFK